MTNQLAIDRREILRWGGYSIGAMALQSLMGQEMQPALASGPHFAPRAKQVVFLTQSGSPSQIELFDPKPNLANLTGQELPESVRMGQRFTSMTAGQKQHLVMPPLAKFKRHGESGMNLSKWLPHIGAIADDICLIRSMHTDFINHAPALTFLLTGHQLPGRPSLGSWLSYGLGRLNRNLPEFAVLVSRTGRSQDQPLYDYYWGSGFLSSKYQGVKLRGGSEPVLYLNNPPGLSRAARREMLDDLGKLNQQKYDAWNDPEISARIAQYEMAFNMQKSVPDLTDIASEPASTFDLYGEEAKDPGSYAYNCLLARRMIERGVRFVQVFLGDWDHHSEFPRRHPDRCKMVDQPSAALVSDLKQRGLLDETLVVWGGEFGRGVTAQSASDNPTEDPRVGRDHHPRCFSVWLAGGGIKAGTTYGATDDFCYNVVENPVHVHDLQATILHLMGIDHERLTYRYLGRDFRLTDVHGHVVKDIVA